MLTKALETLRVSKLIVQGIVEHPANRQHPARALGRFVGWQAWQRVTRRPLTVSAFDNMRLRVHPHSTSATNVLYNRLPDYAEMSFVRDVLRPGDGFLDVGANVGIYTLLAASCAGRGAALIAVEPGKNALLKLRENIALNALTNVSIHPVAVGAEVGEATMTTEQGTTNHIVATSQQSFDGQVVPIATLDIICRRQAPLLAKVDIEGFELEALRGASALLAQRRPAAWILESNHCAARYDTSRADLIAHIEAVGGTVHQYDPDRRELRNINSDDANIIAIIDSEVILQRLESRAKGD